MRTLFRIFKFALFLLLVVVGALFIFRGYRQHVTAQAIAIHSTNGIDEAMYVKIGGIEQWVQVRGQDRNNPVLLCLHGGPGATWLPLTALLSPWEKAFTVVQWDQRGAGKTLEATGSSVAETMAVDRMTQDGIEVAEFLRRHLNKEKVILLGHSWGSILGVHMAKQRPDLFFAYVGTGQATNMPRSQQMSYAHVLDEARRQNDSKTVQSLESIGPPPFDGLKKVAVYFSDLGAYESESDRFAQSALIGRATFNAPNFSIRDIYNRKKGFEQIPTWQLYQEMLSTDLSSLGYEFKVPVYFFQGAQDDVTETSLVQEYVDKISAPHKEVVLFQDAGHFAVWTMPDRFLEELIRRVRPTAKEL